MTVAVVPVCDVPVCAPVPVSVPVPVPVGWAFAQTVPDVVVVSCVLADASAPMLTFRLAVASSAAVPAVAMDAAFPEATAALRFASAV
jgi:hypothetical protein